ncbi:MAG TPA: DUF1631 family protein [Lysobacter sp.]
MSVTFEPHGSALRPTLASAALPRRVRRALEHLYALASDELARSLDRMLAEFEQQLFRMADHARSPGLQAVHFETLRTVRQNRADLIPHFLGGLEAVLAMIREPATQDTRPHTVHFSELRLVDDHELNEESVLRGIATRHEARSGLPLHLLGQRFGVLACAPAFDAERLPVGPHQLGRILGEASRVLQIELEPRLELFRCFDQHALLGYTQMVDAMNALLARENVLPSLAFVPIRARPALQADLTGDTARERRQARALDQPRGQRPHTGWLGLSEDVPDEADETAAFVLLQQLLAGRRDLLGKLSPSATPSRPPPVSPRSSSSPRPPPSPRASQPKSSPSPPPDDRTQLNTADLMAALGRLQAARTGTPATEHGPRSVHEVRQALLAQGRQQHGQAISLSREDNDAFELLGMLYTEIQRELRKDAPSSGLLNRLQVPLLRVALQDRAFFVRSQHPARQLLNAVAESGATWLSDDEADPQLNEQLRHAVDHVVENYHGDANVFEAANNRLQQHLQSMARKAEVSERRYVDAARGKEKLELAKVRAAEVLEEAMRNQRLPKFARSLLTNPWADVLTLTLLRHGEDSDEWARQFEATRHIVAATTLTAPVAAPPGLAEQIEHALTLVGYHADEAGEIARRLTANIDDDYGDPASRTELAMKLKARGRLGQDASPGKSALPPRNAQEQACYEHIRTLPFGTWFEFVTNQQGDVVRRRLSWFSPVTDHALFVNQRGQRVGEQSLDSLARMMANAQTRIVTADRGSLVDRAWHSALNALRSFAGRGRQAAEGQAGDEPA